MRRTLACAALLGVLALAHPAAGIVYKGLHTGLRQHYAVKVLQDAYAASPEDVERFLREARAMARLGKHPNIVQVHTVETQRGKHYFAMDLIDGETLERRIARGGPFPERDGLELGRKVLLALERAHGQGLVHRDVKPSNVLLDSAGEPHVADFGLVKDTSDRLHESRTGVAVGTPAYMAPEQAAGRAATSRNSAPRPVPEEYVPIRAVRHNEFALAAWKWGVFGFGILSPIGVLAGIVALVQLRFGAERDREVGTGMALGGIAIGSALTAVVVTLALHVAGRFGAAERAELARATAREARTSIRRLADAIERHYDREGRYPSAAAPGDLRREIEALGLLRGAASLPARRRKAARQADRA